MDVVLPYPLCLLSVIDGKMGETGGLMRNHVHMCPPRLGALKLTHIFIVLNRTICSSSAYRAQQYLGSTAVTSSCIGILVAVPQFD